MIASTLRHLAIAVSLFALPAAAQEAQPSEAPPKPARWSIAIHGGAGTMSRDIMT
ncbi:MAG: isoaspartyl peptidase/L-asparaginase, partial [Sphingomonadaceae bacterium]|nr:isoaspartyl peptidase/L-asparaginase [Sphingomonadaceae bacterium]